MINQYQTVGDTTEIYLLRKDGTKLSTFIDTADLELVSATVEEWYPIGEGHRTYILRKEKKGVNGNEKAKVMAIHRVIMNAQKGLYVDHIDHDTLNNRRSNLREVTASENAQNRAAQSNNKSGVRGVSWNKERKKWCGQVVVKRKPIYLEFFEELKEAEKFVKEAREKCMPYSKEAV